MATRLTRKERGFVKDIVKGKNGTQAALANYDTKSEATAASLASINLRKPKIVNAIEAALPDELLAAKHREGLFATKGIYKQDEAQEWHKIDEEYDYAVIHKYLDTAYKVKGKYVDKRINIHVPVEVVIPGSLAKKYGIDRSPRKNSDGQS